VFILAQTKGIDFTAFTSLALLQVVAATVVVSGIPACYLGGANCHTRNDQTTNIGRAWSRKWSSD
jgi:hypothetical protein